MTARKDPQEQRWKLLTEGEKSVTKGGQQGGLLGETGGSKFALTKDKKRMTGVKTKKGHVSEGKNRSDAEKAN